MDELLKLLLEISAKLDGLAMTSQALAQHGSATSVFHQTLGPALSQIPQRLAAIEAKLFEADKPAG
jgi:hypothetical protein